jgi:hypothetical protein
MKKTIGEILEAVAMVLIQALFIFLLALGISLSDGGYEKIFPKQDFTNREFVAAIDSTVVLPDSLPLITDECIVGQYLVRDSLDCIRPGSLIRTYQLYNGDTISRTRTYFRIDDETTRTHQRFIKVIATKRGEHLISQGIMGRYLDPKGTRYEI